MARRSDEMMVIAMEPFRIDPSWYERYWYDPNAASKPWSRVRDIFRTIALIALGFGCGLLVGH